MTSSGAGYFVVTTVTATDDSRAVLLTLASVLHRRGVEVLAAELARPAHGRHIFNATFRATPRQASTVLGSMRNVIGVVDASLSRAVDGPGAQHPAAGGACTAALSNSH